MAKLLLDSNVVIDILKHEHDRHKWFLSLLNQNTVVCCEIVVAEVYAGIRAKEERGTREFFENLEYLPIDFLTARLGGRIKNYYGRQGRSLSLADCLIAAAAICNNYELATDNIKDFPMPELKLYTMPKN